MSDVRPARGPVKIDAHQHFWRYDPAAYPWIGAGMAVLQRDFLPPDLEPLLHAAGFDGCVAVQARHAEEETRWLLELAERHSFIRGVVGWVDLRAADVGARLERLAHPKLVGMRHIAQDEPDDAFLLREDFGRGVAALGAAGLAYDILVYPRQLPAALELARRFPGQRFVLDHLAKPDIAGGTRQPWADDLRRLAALPNVSCKLSGMVTEADWRTWSVTTLRRWFDVAYAAFGSDRLLFGSDWPVCLCASSYACWVDTVESLLAPLGQTQRAAIFGRNAARIYRLR